MSSESGKMSTDESRESSGDHLKPKGVPLLSSPKMTEEPVSITITKERFKRAIEIMNNAISTKPAKLARYDEEMTSNSGSDSFSNIDIQRESHQMRHEGFEYNSKTVIPLDMLKLEERHTPLDAKAFLSRIASYDLRLWSAKPSRICAFQCARYGWKIAGCNTLVCVSCRSILCLPSDHGCMKFSEWLNTIENKIRKAGHMSDCIWIKTPSPIHILHLPEGNDMQMFLKNAAQSFQKMETVPIFSTRYRLILGQLDFQGLKSKTSLALRRENKSAAEEAALFLMLNGWTMEGANNDAIKCLLCLRQVPLWLCLSTPAAASIQDIVSPVSSPVTKARTNVKELDPITSHWFWCPWRKALETQDLEKKIDNFLSGDGTNLFSMDDFDEENRCPDITAYLALAAKMDGDFKRGRLLFGPTFEMSDNKTAIRSLASFKELMDSSVRSDNSCSYKRKSYERSSAGSIESYKNDIVAMKAPVKCVKALSFTSSLNSPSNATTTFTSSEVLKDIINNPIIPIPIVEQLDPPVPVINPGGNIDIPSANVEMQTVTTEAIDKEEQENVSTLTSAEDNFEELMETSSEQPVILPTVAVIPPQEDPAQENCDLTTSTSQPMPTENKNEEFERDEQVLQDLVSDKAENRQEEPDIENYEDDRGKTTEVHLEPHEDLPQGQDQPDAIEDANISEQNEGLQDTDENAATQEMPVPDSSNELMEKDSNFEIGVEADDGFQQDYENCEARSVGSNLEIAEEAKEDNEEDEESRHSKPISADEDSGDDIREEPQNDTTREEESDASAESTQEDEEGANYESDGDDEEPVDDDDEPVEDEEVEGYEEEEEEEEDASQSNRHYSDDSDDSDIICLD